MTSRVAIFTSALLLALGGIATPGRAQQPAPEPPSVATMETQFEESFAMAVAMSDEGDPLFALQAWGAVLMSALVLDRARAQESGESFSDAASVNERVLERWQRERPESGGPDLFRSFAIQDPVEKQAAIMALADRYPDDPLVVWQAANALRQAREIDRATQLVETFLARNPGHAVGYLLLYQAAFGNDTQQAEVLERWARDSPGDPILVSRWMGSKLPAQEPAATERLLDAFLSGRPAGAAGLDACLHVMRGASAFVQPARACVARIAGDPGAPTQLAQRATAAMAGIAAEEGDWSALLAALELLEPQARVRALTAAARGLETPERCEEVVALLGAAADASAEDENGYAAVATGLKSCADAPGAAALYVELVRRAPTNRLADVVQRWVVKVNDVYRGEVPPAVRDALERRLENEGDDEHLFRALYLVYAIDGSAERRFGLLRRWWRAAPASFRTDQAAELARGLADRGDPTAGVEVLELQLARRFQFDVAELLWRLHLDTGGAQRAEQFTQELISTGDASKLPVGHQLAARSALLREDLVSAERHYWAAVEGVYPRRDAAVELLATVGLSAAGSLEQLARRICDETGLATHPGQVTTCAAQLLTEAGLKRDAADLLAKRATAHPEDLESLRELAATAQAAGEVDVAERALRRMVELDPRSEGGWINLGVALERQGRVEEVLKLLAEARQLFSPPHSYLYRSAGRALTAAERPREAIDLLLEARGTLPDTAGGEWSRGWIDHELRQAYRELGRPAAAAEGTSEPQPGGDPGPSEHELAVDLLLRGETEAERARGIEVLEEQAQLSEVVAVEILAFVHATGVLGTADAERAGELSTRAAALGSDGLAHLSRQLSHSEIFGELLNRGIEGLEQRSREGDPSAMALLARLFAMGFGRADETAEARTAELARRAAEAGEPTAMRLLSGLYARGAGVEADPEASASWRRRCAEAGDSFCMRWLGLALIEDGERVPSLEDGLSWLRRSAETGNWWAIADLGRLYDTGGHGLVRDETEAAAWKRRLADRGDAESTGWLIYHGYLER